MTLDVEKRMRILTEGAKYDVSCSSSGSDRSSIKGSLGDTAACGICHSFTSDGRCISILKILHSNKCVYDCLYCANRRSVDIPRATLSPDEICEIVINFYRRNYIEGLFLSSAVETSPNHTMQQLTDTVILLRTKYKFNGYIHLKAIPGADTALIENAAKYVDRMSLNIELPSQSSLKLLAPQKTKESIVVPMKSLAGVIITQAIENIPKKERIIPAGQTTQMIIGASGDTDGTILRLTQNLYRMYRLKRVYYSAYVPLGTSSLLPVKPPDMLRENRLYQADWLLRFYGFDIEELVEEGSNLPTDIDPKCAWALRNPQYFPIEISTATQAQLLRVPGIGVKSAWRIIQARKTTRLDFKDLMNMRVVLKRAKYFITCNGSFIGEVGNPNVLRGALQLPSANKQLSIFDSVPTEIANSVLSGQL